jgi:DNA-binding NarL/FixJ family response regulator
MAQERLSPKDDLPSELGLGEPVRVLIVGDVRLYRDGLAQALANYAALRVVATATSGVEAERSLRDAPADVVLLDITMRGGAATTRALLRAAPSVKVIALAVDERDDDILACAEAGIAGYVPPDASIDDLVRAITSAARGELHCSPRVAATLFRRLAALALGRAAPPSVAPLTARELETVRLVARGLSNKEIAARLGIEIATVKNHVHNILEKLQLRRRGEVSARLQSQPGLTDVLPDAGLPRSAVHREV